MTHDPKSCGCTYLGCDMWSCGHVDNQPDETDPLEIIEEAARRVLLESGEPGTVDALQILGHIRGHIKAVYCNGLKLCTE
jgi:hypothetical protein